MLSLTAMGFIPVVDPTFRCWTVPFSWISLRGNPHLLGEELADLMGDQSVVHPDGADAGAAAAEGAAVGQLGQPGDGGPVELDIAR